MGVGLLLLFVFVFAGSYGDTLTKLTNEGGGVLMFCVPWLLGEG